MKTKKVGLLVALVLINLHCQESTKEIEPSHKAKSVSLSHERIVAIPPSLSIDRIEDVDINSIEKQSKQVTYANTPNVRGENEEGPHFDPSSLPFDSLNADIKPAFPNWFGLDGENPEFYRFNCEDCPKSFGSLITLKPGSAIDSTEVMTSGCQGSLVAPDLFLTNRHCIPEDWKEPGSSCNGRAKIVFHSVDTETPGVVAQCDKLIDINQIPTEFESTAKIKDDWAIIKLKSSYPERVTPVLAEGVSDKTLLQLFIVLEDGLDSSHANLARIECETVQKSSKLPAYFSDNSPVILSLCNHPTAQGFSGSPMYVKKEGKWRPVVLKSHIPETSEITDPKSGDSFYYSIGSSVGCIPHLVDEDLPAECKLEHPAFKIYERKLLIEVLSNLHKEVGEEILSEIDQRNLPFNWAKIQRDTWGEVPNSYLQFFEPYLEFTDSVLSLEDRYYMPQSFGPLLIECIDKSQFTDPLALVKLKTAVPTVWVGIEENLLGQWIHRKQISWENADVYRQRNSNQFFLRRAGAKPEMSPQEPARRRIWQSQMSHFELLIPECS